MRSKVTTTLTVLGATFVLLIAGNGVALAATGHGFTLGRVNRANRMTTLVRTSSGTALNVRTKRSYNSPLATNGRGRVVNLNADMVDGLHADSLRTKSYVFTADVAAPTSLAQITIPLPAGNYLISYSAYMNGAANKAADCYVARTAPGSDPNYFGESEFNAGTATPSLTGSGFASLSTGASAKLHCQVFGGTFNTNNDEPIQIVATKVGAASSGSITADRQIAANRVTRRHK